MKRLIRRYAALNLSSLNDKDYEALLVILNYVYSPSSSRVYALNEFTRNLDAVINSSLCHQLPLNMTVTRWYDFSNEQIKEVYEQIEKNGYYQYPYNVYSFSKNDAEDLLSAIRREYGMVVEKDLSNISGYYVDVHEILTSFQNEKNFREFLKNAVNSLEGGRVIGFFIDNGIIPDNFDRWSIDSIELHLDEIAYVEQQEIIIISDDIGKIYENEIVYVKERE